MPDLYEEIKKGNEFIENGEIEEAIAFYTQLMSEFPEEPLIFYNSALAFIEKENFDIAVKLFLHCLNLGFENHRVFLGLGYCGLKAGKFEEARGYFFKIDESEESFLESKIGILYSFILEGKISEARPSLEILKKRNFWNQELQLIEKTIERNEKNKSKDLSSEGKNIQ